MTFGTYPDNITEKWKSRGAVQLTTMDDRYELFVVEQACEDNCDISFPNNYDSFNSTTKKWVDNTTQSYWVTDANKPFDAYSIQDRVCFDLS